MYMWICIKGNYCYVVDLLLLGDLFLIYIWDCELYFYALQKLV